MLPTLTGAPKTVVGITDASNLVATGVGGYICVQGETARGPIGQAVFISSTAAFERVFGAPYADSRFPDYCLRLLSGRAPLYVARSAHYTDVTDKTSVVGTRATGSYTGGTGGTAYTLSVRARYVGPGYNGTVWKVVAPSNNLAGYVDISYQTPGGDLVTVPNLNATLSAADILLLNTKFTEMDVLSSTGPLVPGTFVLATGAQDVSLITVNDYNGSSTSGTGWYSFSKVSDSMRVANIHRPVPEFDAGLVAYCEARGDMRAILAFPVGANAQGMDDYRMGTGSYTHTPLNSLFFDYWGSALNAPTTKDASSNVVFPGILDFVIRRSLVDKAQGPWISAAGTDNAVTLFNRGVTYNLASPDNAADWDRVYGHGINALVEDVDENGAARVYPSGNRSGLLDQTKLTSKSNVADLMVHLGRVFKPYLKKGQFKPNSPKMWKAIYRAILPVIQVLEQGEAFVPGEGSGWFWYGDQNADTSTQATFNTQADINSGRYRVRFICQPTAAAEYIGLELTATDSNSIAAILNDISQ